MNVRELRIGNLVNVQYDDGLNAERVDEIKILGTRYTISTESHRELAKGRVKPIELTEEWLIKFRFIKIGGDSKKLNTTLYSIHIVRITGNYVFELHKSNEGNYGFFFNELGIMTHVNYVHQLQNLYFALTSEELKIK